MKQFFYRGKREKTSRTKLGLLLMIPVLALTLTVGGTLAWLITQTLPVVNAFTPGKITTTVEEKFDKDTKEDVSIKNTGNTTAFIRAAIVTNWVDEAGKVVAPAVAGTDYTVDGLPGANWFLAGSYYYYSEKVEAGANTGLLFTKCTPVAGATPAGAHLQVTILGQGIQANGSDAVGSVWNDVVVVNGKLQQKT